MGLKEKAETVFELIRNACTLQVAKAFLKEKNLSHSAGTWLELFDKRILPALDVGTLTISHLNELLREVEEHGRQHIFLFKCAPDRAALMLSHQRMKAITREMQLEAVALAPLALHLPPQPQIVDLRQESCAHDGNLSSTMVIKQVETRTIFEFAGQALDAATGGVTKKYVPIKYRAVNLARLHPDGTLEVRLASHKNSNQYSVTLADFRSAISPWFLADEFDDLPLNSAKSAILDKRVELSSRIRHGGHTLRNDSGTTLTAKTSSPQDDVLNDGAAEKSLDSFLDTDGWSESSQIYFKIGGQEEKHEVLVLLSGTSNEFAIPLNCTREDYEYVFEQIRTLNK